MRVAIVGASGFVGNYLTARCLSVGYQVSALVRPSSAHKLRCAADVRVVQGGLSAASLRELCQEAETLVYLPGILREDKRRGVTFNAVQRRGAEHAIEAALGAGSERLLLMSALGVSVDGTSYQTSKYAAEQAAWASALKTTVFRPSVIFGDPHGAMEIGTQLLHDMVLKPLPAVAFFNAFMQPRGHIRLSPVHVDDVADAFVAALADPATAGRTIELAGPDVLTWREIVAIVASAVGRNKLTLPMPLELMRLAAACLDWIPAFPATRDQLRMLAEGCAGSDRPLRKLIGREPRCFSPAMLGYLRAAAHVH